MRDERLIVSEWATTKEDKDIKMAPTSPDFQGLVFKLVIFFGQI